MKYPEKMTKKKLGEVLVEEGLLTSEQVLEALKLQKKNPRRLGEILVELGSVTEYDIAKTIAVQFQLPFISLKNYRLDKDLILSLPREALHEHQVVPVDKFEGILVVVMAGFMSRDAMNKLQEVSKCELAIFIGLSTEVKEVLDEYCPLPTQRVLTRAREISGEVVGKKTKKEKTAAKKKIAEKKKPTEEKKGRPSQVLAPDEVMSGSKTFKSADKSIESIEMAEDGTKTYEIKAPNVDDTEEWNKVISEAEQVVPKDGEETDWKNIFDEAEESVRKEIEKRLDDVDEGF
jgi:hypothetical protein